MSEPPMKIMEILVRDALVLNLGVRSKREVLVEMANALAKVEPQIEANRLLEVLLERESLQSTGIGEGVAIPHGKLVGLDGLVASFARSIEGVDFDSIDGQPTHLFFLLVAPGREGSAHLLLLARLSRLLGIDAFRARLREVGTTDELFRAIEEEESRH
jgi:PTS system nitrogen regulatory IIA component